MSKPTYNVFFKGRRPLEAANKRFYKILGTVEIGFASLCLLLSILPQFNMFYLALLFVGIFCIVYALIGRYWMAEKNYIIISPELIEFKNSSMKPKTISRNSIRDVMIESNKAVFIIEDQRLQLYDFSVFKPKEQKEINIELLKIKLEAHKKAR